MALGAVLKGVAKGVGRGARRVATDKLLNRKKNVIRNLTQGLKAYYLKGQRAACVSARQERVPARYVRAARSVFRVCLLYTSPSPRDRG